MTRRIEAGCDCWTSMSVDLIAESNLVSTVGLAHEGNGVDWMMGNILPRMSINLYMLIVPVMYLRSLFLY